MAKIENLDNIISDLEKTTGTLGKIREANAAVASMKETIDQINSQLGTLYVQAKDVIDSASRATQGLELTKIHLEKDILAIEKKCDSIEQKVDGMINDSTKKIESLSEEIQLMKRGQKSIRTISLLCFLLLLVIGIGAVLKCLNVM